MEVEEVWFGHDVLAVDKDGDEGELELGVAEDKGVAVLELALMNGGGGVGVAGAFGEDG